MVTYRKDIKMKKDAGVAAVLNTILPGLGWIYCGKIGRGIISIFIDCGLFYGALFAVSYSSTSGYYYDDNRSIFCLIYLIYWIIQINWVYNKLSYKETSDNNKDSLNSENEDNEILCPHCNNLYILYNEDIKCPYCFKSCIKPFLDNLKE